MTETRDPVYRIVIEGHLAPSWSDRMAGLRIETVSMSSPPMTVLCGSLVDPSALHGVLHTILDLQMPILLVRRLAASENAHQLEIGNLQQKPSAKT